MHSTVILLLLWPPILGLGLSNCPLIPHSGPKFNMSFLLHKTKRFCYRNKCHLNALHINPTPPILGLHLSNCPLIPHSGPKFNMSFTLHGTTMILRQNRRPLECTPQYSYFSYGFLSWAMTPSIYPLQPHTGPKFNMLNMLLKTTIILLLDHRPLLCTPHSKNTPAPAMTSFYGTGQLQLPIKTKFWA